MSERADLAAFLIAVKAVEESSATADEDLDGFLGERFNVEELGLLKEAADLLSYRALMTAHRMLPAPGMTRPRLGPGSDWLPTDAIEDEDDG